MFTFTFNTLKQFPGGFNSHTDRNPIQDFEVNI